MCTPGWKFNVVSWLRSIVVTWYHGYRGVMVTWCDGYVMVSWLRGVMVTGYRSLSKLSSVLSIEKKHFSRNT